MKHNRFVTGLKKAACLLMTAILALSPVCPVLADGGSEEPTSNLSNEDAIFNQDTEKPAEYDTLAGNIYGTGSQPFLLSEQNELYLYWNSYDIEHAYYYDNLDMTITSESDGYAWVKSPNKVNSGEHAVSTDGIGNGHGGFRFLQGVGFDATGSGRKDYAAFIGCSEDNHFYCLVQNPKTGTVYYALLGNCSWVGSADPNYFEMANVMAITAGDYDKDGKDSLIVYCCGNGDDVSLFEVKLNGTSLLATKILDLGSVLVNDEYDNNSSVKYKPIVSLTTGDFNGDGKEQFAYSVGFHNTSGKAKEGWQNKEVSGPEFFATGVGIGSHNGSWSLSNPIWLYDKGSRDSYNGSTEVYNYTMMMGGAISAGDVDGDGLDEIVAVGYTSNNVKGTLVNGVFTKISNVGDLNQYYYVTSVINYTSGGYTRSALSQLSMSTFFKHSVNKYKDSRYVYPQISIACGKTNGKVKEEDVFIAGILYSFKSGSASVLYTPKLMTQTFDKILDDTGTPTDVYWVDSVAVGNFDHNDVGREQFVYTVWFKNKDNRECNVYIGIAGGSEYSDSTDSSGNITAFGTCTKYAGSDVRGDYGHYIYEDYSNASKILKEKSSRYMSTVPMALDLDDDGLLARYSKTGYVYTDPEVLAVLQAGPYFSEIDDLGGYQDPCGTSYSFETSYGYASSSGNSVSFGVGFAGEVSAGCGKLSLEMGYSLDWSESFEQAYEETSTASFLVQERDAVVISRTPELWYCFDIYQNGNWIENGHTIQVPLAPTYYLLSVEDYNSFVESYNTRVGSEALQKITNTDLPADNEGDPFHYWKTWADAGNGAMQLSKQSYQLGYAGGAMASEWSASASQSETTETSHGFTYSMTLQFGGGVGGSAGEAWAGGYVNLDYSNSTGSSKTSTQTNGSSGQVQNISESILMGNGMTQAQVRSYAFTWEFGKWMRALQTGGADVPFYGYRVFNVSALAPQVEVFTAKFQTGDEDSMTILLEWENPAWENHPVTSFILYEYDEDGTRKKIAELGPDVTSYTYNNVNGRTEYNFGITTKASASGVESLETGASLYMSVKSIYDIV